MSSSPSMFNFSGLRSPPRRPIVLPSPTSPFCTSPSQLQEVTALDDDTSQCYSVGMRSPAAIRGRSVKEFEEQLTTLRKENFNLKLRIYFLEERMGTNFDMDQENAVKKNIELLVELESLKKELHEKQQLLCEAVKAMELEDEVHKKSTDSKEKEIGELRQQLTELQQQNDAIQDEVRSNGDHVRYIDSQEYLITTEEESQEFVKELQSKINNLESELLAEKSTIKKLNKLISTSDSSAPDEKYLQEMLLEKDARLEEVLLELNEKEQDLLDLNLKLETVENELQQKQTELETMACELNEKTAEMAELHKEVHDLKATNSETRSLYDHESKKSEKSRVAIANRNARIAELENNVEKYKTKVSNLELKLQTAQNEVKSKPQQPQTSLRSPKSRSRNTDADSFSVRGPPSAAEHSPKPLLNLTQLKSPNSSKTNDERALVLYEDENRGALTALEDLQSELTKSKKHISKLEHDQVKACKIIEVMLETRRKNTREIEELQRNLQKRDTQIQELKDKLDGLELKEKKTLQTRISELNLTAAAPASDAEPKMGEREDCSLDLLEQYKSLTQDLDTQKQILLDTLKEKDAQMTALQAKYESTVKELQVKDNRVVDLEFELLSGMEEANYNCKEKSDVGTEKVTFWIKESEDKDREIDRLEKELLKRTSDLQTIVNKELWEKNREIERLQKRFTFTLEQKDFEVHQLKEKYSNRNEQVENYKKFEAASKAKIKSLNEDLNVYIEENKKLQSEVDELREGSRQLATLKVELAKSENLRTECNDVCNVLTIRLEELAQFLDSLLRQKSILGFLGNKQTSRLRQFVDRSLELSKSLTLNLTMNPDQSLMQLSNISELLNATKNDTLNVDEFFATEKDEDASQLSIIPGHITLTYQSHLNKRNSGKVEEQAEIIAILRCQVENLKHEIELRDFELARKIAEQSDQELINTIVDMEALPKIVLSPEKILENLMSDRMNLNLLSEKNTSGEKALINTSTTIKLLENNSDSESWSEPDRSVSKARIGLLDDESLKPKQKASPKSESTEFDVVRSISRTPSKKGSDNKQTINTLTQQLSELQDMYKVKENQLICLQNSIQELNNKCEQMDNKYLLEKFKNQTIKVDHESLVKKVGNLEMKLMTTEKLLQNSEQQVDDLQDLIADLEKNKQQLMESVDVKSKNVQNKLNELQIERDNASEASVLAERKVEEYKNQVDQAREKLFDLEREILCMETKHKKDIEIEVEIQLRRAEMEYEKKIKTFEANAELQIQNLKENAAQMKHQFELESSKADEIDRLKQLIGELQTVQDMFKSSEQKVRTLEAVEIDLRKKLDDTENYYANKLRTLENIELDLGRKLAETEAFYSNRVRTLEGTETALQKKLEDTENFYANKVNGLRIELDQATLQQSEAVLDKTRLEERKLELEHEVKQFLAREKEFEHQVEELKQDFNRLKDKFHKQVANMQLEKSKLQVKISELQAANVDMKYQAMRTRTGRDGDQAHSAPTSPTSRILEMYLNKQQEPVRKNGSDSSGRFISESHTVSYVNFKNTQVDNSDIERTQANSSPDLGIESDHGRFSSLEANLGVPRPYLKTLELTDNMKQMLDKDQNQLISCANDQCCNNSKDMQNENNYLRKKLQRSNKLLEDTVSQLAKANQRKRDMERTICKQIHKTSQVLRIAKANLDSGSDSDLLRK